MADLLCNTLVTDSGESFIPSSQRPDGTWRKARRVKEGYVPQEEVPLYESKGKKIMSKKPEPIQLASGQTAQRIIPGLYIVEDKEKKQTKKKSKTKSKVDDIGKQLENVKISINKPKQKATSTSNDTSKNQETTDPVKKLKNLKKRLREVEALEEKLKSNLIANPEPDQLAKIQRKNDLLMQIHELEKQIVV